MLERRQSGSNFCSPTDLKCLIGLNHGLFERDTYRNCYRSEWGPDLKARVAVRGTLEFCNDKEIPPGDGGISFGRACAVGLGIHKLS